MTICVDPMNPSDAARVLDEFLAAGIADLENRWSRGDAPAPQVTARWKSGEEASVATVNVSLFEKPDSAARRVHRVAADLGVCRY